jgi:amino acid transporter
MDYSLLCQTVSGAFVAIMRLVSGVFVAVRRLALGVQDFYSPLMIVMIIFATMVFMFILCGLLCMVHCCCATFGSNE